MANQNTISHRVPDQWSQHFQFNLNSNSMNHIDFPIQLKFQIYQSHRFFNLTQINLS